MSTSKALGGTDANRLQLSQQGREYLAAQLAQQQAAAQQAAAAEASRYRVAKSLKSAMEESKTRGATAVKDDFMGKDAEKLAKKALDRAAKGDIKGAEKYYQQALQAHVSYVTKNLGSRTVQLGERVAEGKDVSGLLSDIVERSRVAYDLGVGVQEGEEFSPFVNRLTGASFDKYQRERGRAARRADNAGDTSRLEWRLDYRAKYGVDPITVKVPDRTGSKETTLTKLGAVGLDIENANKYAQDYAKSKDEAKKAISDAIYKQQRENAANILKAAASQATPVSQVGQRTEFDVKLEGGQFVADVGGTKYNVSEVPYAKMSAQQKQDYVQKQLAPTVEYIFKNAGRPVNDYGPNIVPTGQGTVIFTDPRTGQSKEYNERLFVPLGVKSSTPVTAGFKDAIDEKTGKLRREYLTDDAVRAAEQKLRDKDQSVIGASFVNEKGAVGSVPSSFFERPQSQVPFKPDEVLGYAINYDVDKKGRVRIDDATYTTPEKPVISDITNVADIKVDAVPSTSDSADAIRDKQISAVLRLVKNSDQKADVEKYLQSESDKLKGSGKIFDASTLVAAARSYTKAQTAITDSSKVYFSPDPTNPHKILTMPNRVGSELVDGGLRYTLQKDNTIKIELADKPPEFEPNVPEQLWRGTIGYGADMLAGTFDLASQIPMMGRVTPEKLKQASQVVRDAGSLNTLSSIYGGISGLAGKDTDVGRSYKVYSEHAAEQAKVAVPVVGAIGNALGLAEKATGLGTGEATDIFAEQSRKRPIESITTSLIDAYMIKKGVGGVLDLAKAGISRLAGTFGKNTRVFDYAPDIVGQTDKITVANRPPFPRGFGGAEQVSGNQVLRFKTFDVAPKTVKGIDQPFRYKGPAPQGETLKAPSTVPTLKNFTLETSPRFTELAAQKGSEVRLAWQPTQQTRNWRSPVQQDYFEAWMQPGGKLGLTAGRVLEIEQKQVDYTRPRMRYDEKKGEYVFEESPVAPYLKGKELEPFGRDLLTGTRSEVTAATRELAATAKGSKPLYDVFSRDTVGGKVPPSRPSPTSTASSGQVLQQVIKEETPVVKAEARTTEAPVSKPLVATAGSAKPTSGWRAPTVPLGLGGISGLTLLRLRKANAESYSTSLRTPEGYEGPTVADVGSIAQSGESSSKVAELGGVDIRVSNAGLSNWWIRNMALGNIRTVQTVSQQPLQEQVSVLDTSLSTDLETQQVLEEGQVQEQAQIQETQTILTQIQIPGLLTPGATPLDIPNIPPPERPPRGGGFYPNVAWELTTKRPRKYKTVKKAKKVSYKPIDILSLTLGNYAPKSVREWINLAQ